MLGLDSLLTPSVAFTVAITRRAIVISWGTGTRWPWLKLLIKTSKDFGNNLRSIGVY